MARLDWPGCTGLSPFAAEIEPDRPESGLGPRTSEPDPQPRRAHMIDDACVQEVNGRVVFPARLPRRDVGSARVRWQCRTARSGPAIPPVLRPARHLVSSRRTATARPTASAAITTSVSEAAPAASHSTMAVIVASGILAVSGSTSTRSSWPTMATRSVCGSARRSFARRSPLRPARVSTSTRPASGPSPLAMARGDMSATVSLS